MKETLLSSSVTIAQYCQLEAREDRERIADFILERFTERYITPLRGNPGQKHGFCTMAISCLMIEALESFWKGWPSSNGKSNEAFTSFFRRCREYDSKLGLFDKQADEFYTGVRCGILHQAETTKGWHILRKGPLFESQRKTINATKFHDELEKVLGRYCDTLRQSRWDGKVWQNLREKMKAVIKNCNPSPE